MPAEDAGRSPGWRRRLAVVSFVVAGLLLPVGLFAAWAHSTLLESRTFSQRAVDLLDSPEVRRELADRMTEQLALNGNQQAVNFRPAFLLAIEAVIETDTFRSIFRTAVRRTHEAVLSGQTQGTGLDLSDSVSIIGGTLQLPDSAQPGQQDEQALGTSLTDVTDRLARFGVWRLDAIVSRFVLAGLGGFLLAGAAAIALADDRRRALGSLGLVVVVDGLVITALVLGAAWYAGRAIADEELAAAVRGAVSHGMSDLRMVGLWTAGYGIVLAAAARPEGARRLTPAWAVSTVTGWMERRRATTGGTVVLGGVCIVAGLLLIQDPWFWLRLLALATGMWLVYFGAAEMVSLVRAAAVSRAAADAPGRRGRRLALTGAVVAALLLVATAGVVVTTRRAASQANAAGVEKCNGEESLCDLPLNLAVFPGTHNSMSSALYPGWLFGEHIKTIGGQLDAGARALLIDTHYGVPSTSRLPGSETPVILTDRVAELSQPVGEEIDPAIAQRANELAGRAPRKADATRDIYLCHNYCELGAVRFSQALGEIKTFLDHHPDDVVMTIIQDATTPQETAAAIEAAGLGPRVYTLDPTEPLPTLGEMIRSGRTLLVFAENGGPVAPRWYHKAFETWFQDTPYSFTDISQMSCEPNRGPPDAPLFMINHWVTESPPNPRRAAAVNRRAVLEDRLSRCLDERGLMPNVIAVDFAERGDLVPTAQAMNDILLDQVQGARRGPRRPPPPGSATTTRPPAPASGAAPSGPPIPTPTQVTTLTGGDPGAFCERVPATLDVVGAWALANVVSPRAAKGFSDIAYGPAAARVMSATHAVAPRELAQLMTPARERALAAVQTLRDLGLDRGAIDGLADLTQSELSGPGNPDPAAVQTVVLDRLRGMVSEDRLNTAAQGFTASHPELPGLFDLGEVPADVARAAGFDCLVGPGS